MFIHTQKQCPQLLHNSLEFYNRSHMYGNVRKTGMKLLLLTHEFIGQPFEVKSTWSVCLVSEKVKATVAHGLEK